MVMDKLDNFDRANSANINTGAPWTYQNLTGIGSATAEISSNQLHSTDTAYNDNPYRAEVDCLTADHESQITHSSVTLSTTVDVGLHVYCRLDTNNTTPTGYMFAHSKAGGQQILSLVGGSYSLLSTIGAASPASSDVLKGGAAGSTITFTLNGTPTGITDTAVAAGLRCGFNTFRQSALVNIFGNDFQFGPAIAAGPFVRPQIQVARTALARASRW